MQRDDDDDDNTGNAASSASRRSASKTVTEALQAAAISLFEGQGQDQDIESKRRFYCWTTAFISHDLASVKLHDALPDRIHPKAQGHEPGIRPSQAR